MGIESSPAERSVESICTFWLTDMSDPTRRGGEAGDVRTLQN
jgi:hypothetical protein